jgi:hypothetical protein
MLYFIGICFVVGLVMLAHAFITAPLTEDEE